MNNIDHMAYLMPFNSELDAPYRAPKKLKEMVTYIFSHPKVPYKQRQLFIDVSQSGSRGLVNDMAVRAIAMTRYFVENPQQFGHSMENIQFQILRRMWMQVFSHMFKQESHPKQTCDTEWVYLGITYKMLTIENGFWDELLRVVYEKDYHQTYDDMVKHRDGIGLRERKSNKPSNHASLIEGGKHFEYLCSLE